MLTALPAWTLSTAGFRGSNPGAKVFPSCSERRRLLGGSPGESEDRRVLERGRTVRTADLSRFQPPVSRLRGAAVSVSVPRGVGGLARDISCRSHTRWSIADLSSWTTACSSEEDRPSFPTSVVGAIVGAPGCAFFFLPPPPCASGALCVRVEGERTE